MTLYLLPNLLSESRQWDHFLPASVKTTVWDLHGLIAESESGARRFLSLFDRRSLVVALYHKKSPDDEIDFLLEPLKKGERWGLISDAGLPCIADPGHKLVARARQTGLKIEALAGGPSSLMLALMLSGLEAQNFHFHGYLDREPLKFLRSLPQGVTHLFIEAPHRSQELLKTLVETLEDSTFLSVSWDLGLQSQNTLTYKVGVWKKIPLPNLTKRAATFVVLLHFLSRK
jgi:16S rRNA (cytidine1402-2'-O)-methyltransferase